MSLAVDLESLDEDTLNQIAKLCVIKPNITPYNQNPEPVTCFDIDDQTNTLYLPLGVWKHFFDQYPDRDYPRANIMCKKTPFTIETDPKGYRDQNIVAKDAKAKLASDRVVFIAANPGFGKTFLGNYLACYLKLKTVVLCHIDKVNDQWVDEFKSFSTAKVQRIKGSVNLDPTADVYVIGVQKAANMPRDCFVNIGTVIFDEAHIATITAFSKSLLKFQPRYVIGLSATPKRTDGMQKMLVMYFGVKKNFITRDETKDFIVYKVETSFQPELKYNFRGGRPTIDWTTLISSLAYNEDRQNQIVDLVLGNPDHRIMILSDRTQECQSIYDKLIELKDDALLISGVTKKAEKAVDTTQYRVLVAGIKKAGVGFNDPTLTMLILATDRKEVEQLEGRIRTTNNIIYDFVDQYDTLETHWGKREAWYRKRGATVIVLPRPGGGGNKPPVPQKRLITNY